MKNLLLVLFGFLALILAACEDTPLPSTQMPAVIPTATLPPTPTLAPIPTDTPSPPPTATPLPATRLALGQAGLASGDLETAVEQLSTGLNEIDESAASERAETLLALGKSYLEDGRFSDAAATFQELLGLGAAPNETAFLLGRALEGTADYLAVIDAFQTYLQNNPEMAAYIQPRIGNAYVALGDAPAATAAYELAVIGPGHRLTIIENHQRLADLYLAAADYEAAVLQYVAIHDLAQTEFTRGQMTYLAGSTELLAEDIQAATAYFQKGVSQYPRAYESYQGLIWLIEAGIEVDAFQRGLVDYYADAFDPAITAFNGYIQNNPGNYRANTHLYLAWSYEGLGNLDAALAQLELYAAENQAEAQIERAKMLVRAGRSESAIEAYLAYVETFPEGADAPFAAWWAAELTENAGDIETAINLYQSLADAYPWHEDAAEALFHAGYLAKENDGTADGHELAVNLWQQTVQNHPQAEFGSAALVWLLKTGPSVTTQTVTPTITITPTVTILPTSTVTATNPPTTTEPLTLALSLAELEALARENGRIDYYPLRARDLADGVPPFPPVHDLVLPDGDDGRAEAETWLRDVLTLEPGTEVTVLSPILTGDDRFIIGEKLWRAGLLEAAKRELESLRADVSDDALFSYQLALFFRDLGLYRSSILAATSVLKLTNQTVFTAPSFIGRLAYPVYYADLILPLAEQYSYDPLLQFSLVRQESLFESFARSGAAAQGLAQVIPDTGAYIAQRLAWPDFVNDDLYKPYVGLAFGAYYLDQQLRAFDSFTAAALSAYNAGPGNAAIWYEQAGADHDLYLETVNFAETRLYIERIYTGYVVYRFLYRE